MKWLKSLLSVGIIAGFVIALGCSGGGEKITEPEGPKYGIAKLAVPIPKLLQNTVTRVQALVTAEEIDTIRKDLVIGDDFVARGVIGNILVGDNRKITLNGYRSDGVMTHSGYADGLTVTEGDTLDVNIVLLPITGAVRVNGTIRQTGMDSELAVNLGNFNGHSYFLYKQEVFWLEAETIADSLGGILAVISSQEENDFISNAVLEIEPELVYVWIGYTDQENEGEFVWVMDEGGTYTAWQSGEPTNNNMSGDEEHWVVLNVVNRNWNDVSHRGNYYFVVEFF